jgi:phosphatidylglycerophosphate synthase
MTAAVPDLDGYFTRWSALHGGYDPRGSRVVRGYLTVMYVLARPLARFGISPDAVTLLGALISVAAVLLCLLGGRWLLAASIVVVVSGVIDNLDGAVAVLRDRASRFGYVLDSLVDRLSDMLYLVALWMVGAPGLVCVAGAALTGLQEYARARAGNAGMGEIEVVTVSERPTRVLVTATFLLGAGVYPGAAAQWATAGAAAWVAVSTIGSVQLLLAVRRALR